MGTACGGTSRCTVSQRVTCYCRAGYNCVITCQPRFRQESRTTGVAGGGEAEEWTSWRDAPTTPAPTILHAASDLSGRRAPARSACGGSPRPPAAPRWASTAASAARTAWSTSCSPRASSTCATRWSRSPTTDDGPRRLPRLRAGSTAAPRLDHSTHYMVMFGGAVPGLRAQPREPRRREVVVRAARRTRAAVHRHRRRSTATPTRDRGDRVGRDARPRDARARRDVADRSGGARRALRRDARRADPGLRVVRRRCPPRRHRGEQCADAADVRQHLRPARALPQAHRRQRALDRSTAPSTRCSTSLTTCGRRRNSSAS